MEENLSPITQIINIAKSSGATFGHGDAKVHLAYLAKLRLLPQAVRRKVSGKITGCYPMSVVSRLLDIERLKNEGLTYSQIRFELQKSRSELIEATPSFHFSTPNHQIPQANQNTVAFLVIGLFLGFLMATVNSIGNKTTTVPPIASPVEAVSVTPVDPYSQTLVNLITSPNGRANSPIYVIALPQQNLDKLGKVNINYLNKN